ncbi:hypothetical protein [Bizionia paragorgiae]|uniref:Uncharacterized protein n=1 Tax=Bizionia paragorgiae TaxID=283786 RepID=A0A1H4CLF9_BIZPA|nr:hypothetical protein [Bizionia paragorgiae]SEA61169.1 hypothetical protein SAMN04487990_12051 [Bizionia paragorgiae]
MKKLKSLTILTLSVLLMTTFSCENEPLDPDYNFEIDSEIDGNTFGDGSGPPGGPSTGDYWPMAVNNVWTYDYTVDSEVQDPYEMEIDANVNYQGNSVFRYLQFMPTTTATDGAEFEGVDLTTYSRKNGGDYIMTIGDLQADYLGGMFTLNQNGYSIIVLKDYEEVGATWVSTAQTTTSFTALDPTLPELPEVITNLEYNFEIAEKGVSVEVNGVTYNDVIKVEMLLNSYSPEFPSQVITAESELYYALDVGIIKSVSITNDEADGVESVSVLELNTYSLN